MGVRFYPTFLEAGMVVVLTMNCVAKMKVSKELENLIEKSIILEQTVSYPLHKENKASMDETSMIFNPFNGPLSYLYFKCSLRSNFLFYGSRGLGITGERSVQSSCYKNFRQRHFVGRKILFWSTGELNLELNNGFKRDTHALDDAFLSTQDKPYLEPNGMTMVLGGRRVNITSPEFEELLLDILTKISEEVESLGDKKVQKEYLANFYTNMFDFINEILMPARYNAFKEGRIKDNTAVHKIHRVLMRQLYSALAQVNSPLVPACWKALKHDDPTCNQHITKEEMESGRTGYVLDEMRKAWKAQKCSEFDDDAFPDDRAAALRADDLDLTGPRFVLPRIIQLRGHKKYNVLDEERTENAILRLYECTQMKISKIRDDEERKCYNLTFIHNMRLFYNQLVKNTKNTDVTYSKVRDLITEQREKDVIDNEEAYLRSLIRPYIRKNDTVMELGDEDLVIDDPKFEENLFRAYIRIEKQMNRIEDPHLRKRLMAAFNEYLFEFITVTLMPIRYKAFEEERVESNTYLHMLKRSLMRRMYMSLAQTGSSSVPECWKDLYKYLDEKPGEEVMTTPLGWEKNDCSEFTERALPDVTIHALKLDDLDLTAPRFINPRFIQIRGHIAYPLENEALTQSAIVRFYKCKNLKISQIKNDYERNCFNETFNMNMKQFYKELNKCIVDTDLNYFEVGNLIKAIKEQEKIEKTDEPFVYKIPTVSDQDKNVTENLEIYEEHKNKTKHKDSRKRKAFRLAFLLIPTILVLIMLLILLCYWCIPKVFFIRKTVEYMKSYRYTESPKKKPEKKPIWKPPLLPATIEEQKKLLTELDTEDEDHKNLFIDPPIYMMVPKVKLSEPRMPTTVS